MAASRCCSASSNLRLRAKLSPSLRWLAVVSLGDFAAPRTAGVGASMRVRDAMRRKRWVRGEVRMLDECIEEPARRVLALFYVSWGNGISAGVGGCREAACTIDDE